MRVALKMMLVFSVNTSSSSVNFDMSTLMAPVWRQATEKFDGSSLRPSGWPHPPLRACEMWQVTPATFGSSKSATHTLSLGERKLNVVLTQLSSSARAKVEAATKRTAAIKHSFIFDLHFRGAFWGLRAVCPVPSAEVAEASPNAACEKHCCGSTESSFRRDLRGPGEPPPRDSSASVSPLTPLPR